MSRAAAATASPVVVGAALVGPWRRSPESEQALAQRAILAALRDAGLGPADVDGVVRFDRAALWEFDLPGVRRVADLRFYNAVPYSAGSAPALLRMAAMAIATGLAETVVVHHARNPAEHAPAPAARLAGGEQYQVPFGVTSAVHEIALVVRRWLLRRRVPDGAIAAATLMLRRHAVRNPRALVRRPLTRAAHARSPFVAEPLRAVDVAPEAAAAGALVVTSAARATKMRRATVAVVGSMQLGLPATGRHLVEWWRADRDRAMAREARAMFRRARVRPDDVDVAYLHDASSALVLPALEHYGFCAPGTAGAAMLRGLRRPRVNPGGGALHEGLTDGIAALVDAVRQVRGDAPVAVRGARTALVAGSPLEPTSAVLLRRAG